MAITPTGAIYKTLNFDGRSSGAYGVYITGDAVFNAPQRAVEMINIPGRNGAFALDQGRFENIEVSYPAGIFADNEADFAEAISDFRNYLCSRSGYCRLTDDYNHDEYRLAIYKSGLEVDPALLRAGEFTITFECKPQRFLNSGEVAVAVSSGDTITNPTLFESGPLLEVDGYGTIEFNDYSIELENNPIGEVLLHDGVHQTINQRTVVSFTLDFGTAAGYLNVGDAIRMEPSTILKGFYQTLHDPWGGGASGSFLSFNLVSEGSIGTTTVAIGDPSNPGSGILYGTYAKTLLPQIDLVYGTPYSITITTTFSGTLEYYNPTRTWNFNTLKGIHKIAYDGDHTITIETTCSSPKGDGVNDTFQMWAGNPFYIEQGKIIGVSTKSTVTSPIYIDCDIGSAYFISNGEVVSLNEFIDLGSELPTLGPGSNTIIFDNTITQLEITPKWWKV